MKLNSTTVDNWLKGDNQSCRIFLIYGQDEGQICLTTHKFIRHYVPEVDESFNLTTLSYAQIKDNPHILNDEMISTSLLGGRRVLVVESCPATFSADLMSVVKTPKKGDTIVIFKAGELKKTSNIRKEIEASKSGCAIGCYKDSPEGSKRFIAQYLHENSMTFEPDVIPILAQSLYPDRLLVKSELDKLITYKGNEKQIKTSDIAAIIVENPELSLDDLCVAIGVRNKKIVYKYVERIEKNDLEFMLVLRVLLNYFSRIWSVKALMKEGKDLQEAISYLSPPVFFTQRNGFMKVLNNLSPQRTINLVRDLIKLEAQCKRATNNPSLLLSHFILKAV